MLGEVSTAKNYVSNQGLIDRQRRERVCNSHSLCIDSEIQVVTKNRTSDFSHEV